MPERPPREFGNEDIETDTDLSNAKILLGLVQEFLRETEAADYSSEAQVHAQRFIEALEDAILSRGLIPPAAWLRARAELGLIPKG